MDDDPRPVVVAFDGSEESQEAVRSAASLFGDRPLVVVSVWEPGMALVAQPAPDPTGLTYPLPDPEQVEAVDRIQSRHAAASAEAGAAIARELGAQAEAVAAEEGSGDVAETIETVAAQRGAAVVVVGSRGLGGVKATLLGSVSRRLLHDAARPVLVVRRQDDAGG